MPSITAYSPYETLTFFQSVARHGAGASALQDISIALKHNEHIREGSGFDVSRFSIDALQGLYHEHISREGEKHFQQINGDLDNNERSPKRRKLSNSVEFQDGVTSESERTLQNLIEQLYAQYKDDVVREIRKDEEEFLKLQKEIETLETQIEAESKHRTTSEVQQSTGSHNEDSKTETLDQNGSNAAEPRHAFSRPVPTTLEQKTPTPAQIRNDLTSLTASTSQEQATRPDVTGELTAPRPVVTAQPSKLSQPPAPAPSQHQSPGGASQQLRSPSPQRPLYGTIQAQPIYPPGQTASGHVMQQTASAQQRPLARNQQAGNQGRGSPLPYQSQHHYPPYPQYPPQWHPHMSPQHYQQHAAYGPPPAYYPQLPNNRHPHTPQQIPYASYPHATPIQYVQQQQQQQWRGQQWPVNPVSAATTPIPRPDSRVSMQGSGSSTPWRRKQQSTQFRQKSPARPEREVSPLTDREDSPVREKPTAAREIKSDVAKKVDEDIPVLPQPRRRGRPPSITPSAIGQSRSQSIASRASDAQNERYNASRRGQRIKAEPPSTPLPVPSSDTEQRSSGNRGRPRSSTLNSQHDTSKTTATKRKRDSGSPSSPIRTTPTSFVTRSSRKDDGNEKHDPALIRVSKNFAKTSQLLLSGITSHKLAGIFAKPLSERDAPGYKDLVSRPQDLKSVKAAVSKGSRAALAAIEAIEGDHDTTPANPQSALGSFTGVGQLGNGFYLVPKTADLTPPKGIVNSAQLEMELVRIFANAVMFNPLPPSERGFGRSLRLRKNGGDVDIHVDPDTSASDGSENSSLSGADEGGIISDAKEMFRYVVERVAEWRELEGERMGSYADANISRQGSLAVPIAAGIDNGRHASASPSSNVGDDEMVAGESEAASTPVPATSGPGRKRRRITEH